MNLVDVIKKHEGCRLDMYKDTVGVWTIGYGHNLAEGIDQETKNCVENKAMCVAAVTRD